MNFFKALFSHIFIIIILLLSCDNSGSSEPGFQRSIAFTEGWHFRLGDSSEVFSSNEEWRQLDLPHDWSIEGDFGPDHPAGVGGGALPGGMGWYKKTFKMKEADSTKVTSVLFDGVYHNSEVWINGNYLGFYPNGYLGFYYDLTPHLTYGEDENEILVKVDNSQQPNSRWYSGSGIYRNVWLTTTDKLHVAQWGTFVTTPFVNADSTEVQIDVILESRYNESRTATVTTTLFFGDREVNAVSEEVTIGALGSVELSQFTNVTNPNVWSVDEPQLYTAVTEIDLDGQIVDRYETTFGIRSFEFDLDRGFILNGEQVKIKGVCLHHDLGALGSAINTSAIRRQLQIMKDMGVNGIRTAHNPPAPEFLDLCDEMGFIVMNESFDMWEKGKTEFDYSNHWGEWHEKDMRTFIKRDRNHPSVIIWSIGNEIPEQWSERGAEIGRALSTLVKQMDNTRPVTAGMNPPIHVSDEDVTLQFEEAAQPNALAGSGALDIIGYNYAHQTYAHHQKNFPNTPFIAAETTSALATRGYYEMPSDTIKIWPVRWDIPFDGGNPDNTVSAYDQVRTPWGSTHEETWKVIKKHSFLSGMFVWTGYDYIGEPTPYSWPSRSSYFGIVDLAGFPKDTYYMYQSEWSNKDVLHVFPHWNWEEGMEVDVWAYSSTQSVELFLNGKSLGRKQKEGDDLHLMWRLPFEPGTLRAVSYNENGEVVLEKEVKTAGEAAKIRLTAERNNIKANGNDLAYVIVEVLDKDGVLVPRANNNISFEIEGPGRIEGVASGDPTSHESFKASQRKVFHGKASVIIKGSREPGSISLKATSGDLQSDIITIKTE